eukprot:3236787-Pyramimonas_sp.AAC.1
MLDDFNGINLDYSKDRRDLRDAISRLAENLYAAVYPNKRVLPEDARRHVDGGMEQEVGTVGTGPKRNIGEINGISVKSTEYR